MESLRALTSIVMREGLVDQFGQLFNEDNYANLRVCSDGGRCVCHVGMIERGAVLFGCPIKVGCIGGVCTLPEYRKQGLASACFDDALRKAVADGVDLMIVSGDRNLYRMHGCVHVGSDDVFTLTGDASVPVDREITVERMTDAELPLVMECYRAEPARFVRPPDDYGFALRSGWVMNRPSEFLVIRSRGAFRGYVIAPSVHKDGSASLAEFAGDRHAILAALPAILNRQGLTSLSFQVMRHDALMRSLCEQAGLPCAPHVTPGTVTILNFPQLMERVAPRLVEILGERTASRLRFRQEEDRYVFALDDDVLTTDRADAARVLFGKLDGMPTALAEREGTLAEALRAALPLPTLWYGINYV
jgi:hypothetical protein